MTTDEKYTVVECRGHWHVSHFGEDLTCALSEAEARTLAAQWNSEVEAARADNDSLYPPRINKPYTVKPQSDRK